LQWRAFDRRGFCQSAEASMSRASISFLKKRSEKIPKSPSVGADLRPVLPERQSVMPAATGRLAAIVVP
jgi:hypothetical protein